MVKGSPATTRSRSRAPASGDGRPRRGRMLKERAYDRLRRMILSGKLEPGVLLSERRLAAQLEMSKTPVRAALERLAGDGLVTVSPQQGILIREMSIQEVADSFGLRQALEPYVVRELAGRVSPEQAEELMANIDAQQRACEEGDIPHGIDLDCEFHLLFCRALGNEEITRVMTQLRDRIQGVIVRVVSRDPQRMTDGFGEHRRLAELVIDGQGAAAAELMSEHLDRGKLVLMR